MSKLKVDVPVTIVYSASCTGIVASSINMVKSPTLLDLLSGFLSITFFILMMIVAWKFHKLNNELEKEKRKPCNYCEWLNKAVKSVTIKKIPSKEVLKPLTEILNSLEWHPNIEKYHVVGYARIGGAKVKVMPGRYLYFDWRVFPYWEVKVSKYFPHQYPVMREFELYLLLSDKEGKYMTACFDKYSLQDLPHLLNQTGGAVKELLELVWKYYKLSSHSLKNEEEVVA